MLMIFLYLESQLGKLNEFSDCNLVNGLKVTLMDTEAMHLFCLALHITRVYINR